MSLRLAMIAVALVCSAGCGTVNRSMLFFTHTTIGIEVSTRDPSNPIGAILGFKRAEGVINPVYDSEGIATTGGAKYRDEAYSVLATLRGKGSANAAANVGTEISGGQWFATGEAAKILARQPGIAGAISGSPDIAEAEAKIRGIAQGIPTSDQPVAFLAMDLAYEQLKKIAATSSTEARNLKERLDGAAASFSGKMPFKKYDYDSESKKVSPVKTQPTYENEHKFKNVTKHLQNLSDSVEDLSSFVSHWTEQAEDTRPNDYADKQEILAIQKLAQESFLKDWGNRKEVIQLIEWFITYLTGGTDGIRRR